MPVIGAFYRRQLNFLASCGASRLLQPTARAALAWGRGWGSALNAAPKILQPTARAALACCAWFFKESKEFSRSQRSFLGVKGAF